MKVNSKENPGMRNRHRTVSRLVVVATIVAIAAACSTTTTPEPSARVTVTRMDAVRTY